ncbi:MAG: penicillin-binding protein 1C [Nitrospirae bacterium]|nr:MAG: penicillin-binding protein 1C [Nitrospirota bacterium]
MPAFDEVKNSYKKSDAVLLDRHGKAIHELRVDSKGRRLDWVRLKDVSPALIKAVVHSEDMRFYGHHGVDWGAIGASAVKNLFSGIRRGGSTITMQVVSILDKKLKPKRSKRTFGQKWDQMNAAKEIEGAWSKDEIIEAYINLIFFRGELQGISAASRGLFDKEPSGLNESESLILASLIRSPNAGIEDVAKRACRLGNSIESNIKCEEIKTLAQKTLTGSYSVKQNTALAPHAARHLFNKEPGSLVVQSTLDGELQLFASEALNYQLNSLKKKNVRDGAVLVVENKTGDILAYVASSGGQSSARHVDGIMARRQAGSTLKPFLYELAIEKNLLTASSILNDSPLNITTASGQYIPQDYDKDFKGLVSVRTALSGSLNIPAVRTLMLIGPDTYVNRLNQLGFDDLNDGDYYGLSLALGSADVSLYELVNAYRTLANSGRWSGLRLSRDVSFARRREVMEKEAVFIISDILSDREARGITFGFENPLATRFWTAVKTGTSKDMRDNWCIGYSEGYTVGIWVGNFSGEPMWNVSGITGAAPIWLEIMSYLHRSSPSSAPKPPDKVIAKKIKFQNAIESEKEEWYIRGSEPANDGAVIALNAFYAGPRIIYPIEGTIIALDPDIPEEHQRVFFEMTPSEKGFAWILNNEKVGDSMAAVSWLPKQGRYTLSLADNRNHIMDSIEFEVRGSDEGQTEYGMQ